MRSASSVDFYIQLHEIAPTNVLAYLFCEIWLQLVLSRFKNVVQQSTPEPVLDNLASAIA